MAADGGQAVAVSPDVEPLSWATIGVDIDGSRIEAARGEWWVLTRSFDADGRAGEFSVEPIEGEVYGQAVEVADGLRAAGHEALLLAAQLDASVRVDDVAGFAGELAGELSRLAGDNPALQARAAAAAWGLVGLAAGEGVGR
jgi:hypothetical protein